MRYGINKKEKSNEEKIREERKIIEGLRADADTNARCGIYEKWIEVEIRNSEKRIKELENK